MKRMVVETECRRREVAGLMLRRLETLALEIHFRSLRLQTGIRQPEALGLYESLGYQQIPYYEQYANRMREPTTTSTRFSHSAFLSQVF